MLCELQQKKQNLRIIDIVPLATNDMELFEIKYCYDGLKNEQVGTMVRFASYICALARANLYRAIELVDRTLRPWYGDEITVAYVDTDSMAIKIDRGFTVQQRMDLEVVFQRLEQVTLEYNEVCDREEQCRREILLHEEELQLSEDVEKARETML